MTFRDFAEDTKDAVVALAAGVRDGRDITPMVHLATENGRELVAVDMQFFSNEEDLAELVERFIVPLVQERQPTFVGWTFTVSSYKVGREESVGQFVIALIVDAERHETWIAPNFDEGIGEWLGLGPNSTYGLLIGPVQEALT